MSLNSDIGFNISGCKQSKDDIFNIAISLAFQQSKSKALQIQDCHHQIKYLWQKIGKTIHFECQFSEFNHIDTLCKQCCMEFIFITNGLKDLFSFIKTRNVPHTISLSTKIIHLFTMLSHHEFALCFILRNKSIYIKLTEFLNDVINHKNNFVHHHHNLYTKSMYSNFIERISFLILKMHHKMNKYHLHHLSSNRLNLKMNILDLPFAFMETFFTTKDKYIIPKTPSLCGSFDAIKENFCDLFIGIIFTALFHKQYFKKCACDGLQIGKGGAKIKCKEKSTTLKSIPLRARDNSNIYAQITDTYLSCIWACYSHLLHCSFCADRIKTKVLQQSEILLGNLTCQYRICNKKSNKCPLKLCKQCKVVYYCSRKCQKKDWNAVHRYICRCIL